MDISFDFGLDDSERHGTSDTTRYIKREEKKRKKKEAKKVRKERGKARRRGINFFPLLFSPSPLQILHDGDSQSLRPVRG